MGTKPLASAFDFNQSIFPKNDVLRLVFLCMPSLLLPVFSYGLASAQLSSPFLVIGAAFIGVVCGIIWLGATIKHGFQPYHNITHSLECYKKNGDFPKNMIFGKNPAGQLCKMAEELAWEIESLKAQHEAASIIDDMTGLLNRRIFKERAKEFISLARRGRATFSLALVDLDHFKKLNEEKGYSTGDQTLREAATLVRDTLRDYDIICRWSGQQFAILMPTSNAGEAHLACERLRHTFEQHQVSHINGQALTLSIGITDFEVGDLHIDDIAKRADALMVRAKMEGRNRTVVEGDVLSAA
jgi:diguanylate cyclase (GGDEF)-like protein